MNIDALRKLIESFSSEPDLPGLLAVLRRWKDDDSTVADLESRVEMCLANAQFLSEVTHGRLHEAWNAFRRDAIQGIGGMTMNERLYHFGLFERFDSATPAQRENVHRKLRAYP